MFMHSIKLENILSFGPDAQELELKPLNVLIGPNGSGKSNLLEVIGLLRAAPSDVMAPIREGGGSENWIWRGEPKSDRGARGGCLRRTSVPFQGETATSYSISLVHFFGTAVLKEEIEKIDSPSKAEDGAERYLQRSGANVVLSYLDESGGEKRA